MKYQDLIRLTADDDGFPISSLEKAKVVKLKESDGIYQEVLVHQEKADIKYRILIKPDSARLTDADIGRYISLKSSPADTKGLTKGLTFTLVDEKPRVIVTKSATVMISDDPSNRGIVQAPVEEVAQVAEPAEEQRPKGPSDGDIIESFYERLYILEMIDAENEKMGRPFTRESLLPMVTSMYIDAQRTKNKILPSRQWKPTRRFDPIEKPHQAEAQASAKKAEESLLKGADMAMVEALKNDNESRFREVIKVTGLSSAVDVKGAPLDWSSVNRPVLIRWMFIKKGKVLSKRVKPTFDSISKFFLSLPVDLKSHVAIEAMIYNEVEKSEKDYNPDMIYDPDANETIGQAIAPFMKGVEHSNMVAVAMNYFSNQPSQK